MTQFLRFFILRSGQPASRISRIKNKLPHASYSSVPNISAGTFNNFEDKFPPSRSYFGLHVYLFWEKIPPCTALFWSARLMFSKNFPTCTFISSYTSIWYTRLSWIFFQGQQIFSSFTFIPCLRLFHTLE